jgi:hypothetical protein
MFSRGGRIIRFEYSGALRTKAFLIFNLMDIGRADVFADMMEIRLRRIEMPRVYIPYESLDCMHRRKRYTAELTVFYRCSNDAIKISFSGIIITHE